MDLSNKKKLIVGVFLLLVLISIPLTLSIVAKPQDNRSHASSSTTLLFLPVSSVDAPITKNVGDTFSVDMMLDPGTNLATFVKYQVNYDPTKVQLVSANPVTLNSVIFSSVEGPVQSSGSIAQSVSIGSDPTKAISQITKVVSLNFQAIGPTNGTPTTISYGTASQVLSAGPSDQASQNVLATTIPATIVINGTANTTPSPSSAPILTPQPTISGTSVTFSLFLHGVGAGGDNPNPSGNSLSNKSPVHPQRNLDVEVYDTNNQIVASTSAAVTYDSATGTVIGALGLGTIPAGNYNFKIKTDRYLRRLVPGIAQIKVNEANPLPATQMVAGDTNGDNFLNILDYNALLDCGYGELNPLPAADPNSKFNTTQCSVHTPVENVDLDDNGVVNSYDYNLFLRELSVQNGD